MPSSRMLVCALTTVSIQGWAADPAYPIKPIRLISPFAAGGGNTVMARLVGQRFTDAWGQQVVVDNRPGGNSVVGTEAAARAQADGYTLFMLGSSHTIVPLLVKTIYDPIKDFQPLGTIARNNLVLVANNALPVDNVRQLIALAKTKSGQLNYATYGSGTSSHLGMELLSRMAGIQFQHIPYKGASPALTDLIAGQVQVFLCTPPPAIPLIKSGRVKALAVSGTSRSATLPEVPTIAESGVPGFDVMGWYGVAAPAGTPRTIVARLAAELAKMSSIAEMRDRLNNQGVEPYALTPEQTLALMQADSVKWAKVIRSSNIKLDD